MTSTNPEPSSSEQEVTAAPTRAIEPVPGRRLKAVFEAIGFTPRFEDDYAWAMRRGRLV